MAAAEKKLKAAGLDVRKLKIDTGGSVEKNVALIKFEIERAPEGKKIVLIGHSKVAENDLCSSLLTVALGSS